MARFSLLADDGYLLHYLVLIGETDFNWLCSLCHNRITTSRLHHDRSFGLLIVWHNNDSGTYVLKLKIVHYIGMQYFCFYSLNFFLKCEIEFNLVKMIKNNLTKRRETKDSGLKKRISVISKICKSVLSSISLSPGNVLSTFS